MRSLLPCIVIMAALAAGVAGGQTPVPAASSAGQASSTPQVPSAPQTGARVEARSKDLLAVGVVHDGKMSIHVSRFMDNAPVRDAVVTVMLRGTAHPTTAETDGSYALETQDLTLPGAATVEFQVDQGAARETLKGTLDIARGAEQPEEKNSARQLWWWVLNFAVCFGVLWLISRRRKAAKA